jgi:hypothetical protein
MRAQHRNRNNMAGAISIHLYLQFISCRANIYLLSATATVTRIRERRRLLSCLFLNRRWEWNPGMASYYVAVLSC